MCCAPSADVTDTYTCYLQSSTATVCVLQSANRVLSQLKRLARALWSNPPTHGARIAAEVVGDADMFELWKQEVRPASALCWCIMSLVLQ